MPKRTNEFQHLVTLIEKALRPEGALVTESKELLDKITNKKREVDIFIEIVNGIHTVAIGVECKGGERPRRATVEWVEQMWGKHTTLPTDKLILVSKAGFSKAAEKKAFWLDIGALSLSKAEDADWDSVVRKQESMTMIDFLRPYATRVTVVFGVGPDEEEFELSNLDLQASMLYDDTGTKVTTPQNLVEQWLNDPVFLKEIEKLSYSDSGTIIEFERRLKPGVYLVDDTGTKRHVVAINVRAKCRKEVSRVELKQGSYGIAAVSYGNAMSFGRPVQVLLVQQPGDDPIFIASVKRQISERQ